MLSSLVCSHLLSVLLLCGLWCCCSAVLLCCLLSCFSPLLSFPGLLLLVSSTIPSQVAIFNFQVVTPLPLTSPNADFEVSSGNFHLRFVYHVPICSQSCLRSALGLKLKRQAKKIHQNAVELNSALPQYAIAEQER